MAAATVTQDRLIYTLSSNGTYYSVKPENKSITTANILPEISGIPVTTIGGSAFERCSELTSINIPNSVTSIGDRAFWGCSLTSITIPDSVTIIGNYAFRDCSELTKITIPNSVTSIGQCAFDYCTSLTSVIIGNSVTSIGQSAFYQCSKLTSINIPNGVTTIKDRTFYYCSSLTSINMPDSVTSIGNDTFHNCRSLMSITIPGGVTTIGESAFFGCTSLKTAIIGINVKSLGASSFSDCTSLTTFIIRSNSYFSEFSNGVDVEPDLPMPLVGAYTDPDAYPDPVEPDVGNTNPIENCPNLTKVYFTSTTAGYVDGGTWCSKTLKYLDWDGESTLLIDTETPTINLENTDVTVNEDMNSSYVRYTDTNLDGKTYYELSNIDLSPYICKYDTLSGKWTLMNYMGGPTCVTNLYTHLYGDNIYAQYQNSGDSGIFNITFYKISDNSLCGSPATANLTWDSSTKTFILAHNGGSGN